MPKGVYLRTRPTGFLHAQLTHIVSVDTIGEVYRGRNKREAQFAVKRWTKFSNHTIGRASGKRVTHSIDGKLQ